MFSRLLIAYKERGAPSLSWITFIAIVLLWGTFTFALFSGSAYFPSGGELTSGKIILIYVVGLSLFASAVYLLQGKIWGLPLWLISFTIASLQGNYGIFFYLSVMAMAVDIVLLVNASNKNFKT